MRLKDRVPPVDLGRVTAEQHLPTSPGRPLRVLLRRPLLVGLAALTTVALTTLGLAVLAVVVLATGSTGPTRRSAPCRTATAR
ncbi:hypothetical protein A7K94_0212485 [Modestobacter sp. VKM Ac-2676]|nr:hypothetical protein A7K94_0212485 [Modestobacter sp. VKM Ac-2676]